MTDPGCCWCAEPVLPTERHHRYANGPVAHWACAVRQVLGSVAHLEQRCSCYVPGAQEGDPAGVSKREAAEAAVRVWRTQTWSGRLVQGAHGDAEP